MLALVLLLGNLVLKLLILFEGVASLVAFSCIL